MNERPEYAWWMRKTLEREIKLTPGEGFVMPQLGAPIPSRIFVTTYHDTADLRLARRGITLRYRVEDGTGVWQLKLPQGNARLELESGGTPVAPATELHELLTVHLRGDTLVPVARLRTRRDGMRTADAEIVEDNVSVMDGLRVKQRFRELEVELLHGGDETLRRIERELRAAGAEVTNGQPKLHRVLDLGEPQREIEIPPGASPREALALALAEQGRRLLLHDPGTRLGRDPEELHQLRVATRRTRAFLRAARPVVGREWADSLRASLQAVGSALGPVRDLDVLEERFRAVIAAEELDVVAAAPLLEDLARERDVARVEMLGTMNASAYLDLVDRLAATTKADLPKQRRAPSLQDVARAEIRRARRLARSLDASPPDDALHELRILVKRARYATELAAHELGDRATPILKSAKQLQQVLGDHQDAVVADGFLESALCATVETADVVARLREAEETRRMSGRAQWAEAWNAFEVAAKG